MQNQEINREETGTRINRRWGQCLKKTELDPLSIANEFTRIIDGEEYIVSQVRVCRKCKRTLPLDLQNVEEYADKENRIILWQHKKCHPNDSTRWTHDGNWALIDADEKQNFLYPNRGL